MSESIYDYVLEQLQLRKRNWGTVANDTGISKRTIEKIAYRTVKDPGVHKIEKLAAYFRARPLVVLSQMSGHVDHGR